MEVKIDKKEVLSSLPGVEGAEELVEKALENGQEHLFEDWVSKSPEFRETLIRELARIDWEIVAKAISLIVGDKPTEKIDESRIIPLPMRTIQEQEQFRHADTKHVILLAVSGRPHRCLADGGYRN